MKTFTLQLDDRSDSDDFSFIELIKVMAFMIAACRLLWGEEHFHKYVETTGTDQFRGFVNRSVRHRHMPGAYIASVQLVFCHVSPVNNIKLAKTEINKY